MLLSVFPSATPASSGVVRYGLLLALTSGDATAPPPVVGVRYGLLLALTCNPDAVRRLNVVKTGVVNLNPVRSVVAV